QYRRSSSLLRDMLQCQLVTHPKPISSGGVARTSAEPPEIRTARDIYSSYAMDDVIHYDRRNHVLTIGGDPPWTEKWKERILQLSDWIDDKL
ncbi:MAG: hypothetical protein AAF585_02770, partial [Verrucomicrobiota bacterium]